MAKPRIPKQKQKKFALKHLKAIFDLATNPNIHQEQKDNLTKLARKTAMKVRLRMPKQYKRRYCTHCYSYLTPDTKQRVRVRNKKVIILCKTCKKFTRIPIIKKKTKSRT